MPRSRNNVAAKNRKKKIFKLAKKTKKLVMINTYRTISPNYLKVKKFFENVKEEITHITIYTPYFRDFPKHSLLYY